MEFSIKRKYPFFLKWIVFSFSCEFQKKIFIDPPQNDPFSSCTIYSKKKKYLSFFDIDRFSQIRVSFHKKPVCNLIKREVSKSTKGWSIDLCNSSPNGPIDFSHHFSTSARKKFDCPYWCTEMQKQRNRRFVYTVHLRDLVS